DRAEEVRRLWYLEHGNQGEKAGGRTVCQRDGQRIPRRDETVSANQARRATLREWSALFHPCGKCSFASSRGLARIVIKNQMSAPHSQPNASASSDALCPPLRNSIGGRALPEQPRERQRADDHHRRAEIARTATEPLWTCR